MELSGKTQAQIRLEQLNPTVFKVFAWNLSSKTKAFILAEETLVFWLFKSA
jgi:hypothetical protein